MIRQQPASDPAGRGELITVDGLVVRAPGRVLLRVDSWSVEAGGALAVLGPSGVGKSTFLRCLNRLVDLTPGLAVEGRVTFRGRSVRDPDVDPDVLRTRIGFLFQQPVVFPRSIRENVLFGARHQSRMGRREAEERVEAVLREAALWEEVRDRLQEPALRLSVGQQQRLCLARALALDPEVLLLDEPTSALDAGAAARVEESLGRVRGRRTLVLVTHDHAQARRLTERAAWLERRGEAGELVRVEDW